MLCLCFVSAYTKPNVCRWMGFLLLSALLQSLFKSGFLIHPNLSSTHWLKALSDFDRKPRFTVWASESSRILNVFQILLGVLFLDFFFVSYNHKFNVWLSCAWLWAFGAICARQVVYAPVSLCVDVTELRPKALVCSGFGSKPFIHRNGTLLMFFFVH